jgi:hypothetical protein
MKALSHTFPLLNVVIPEVHDFDLSRRVHVVIADGSAKQTVAELSKQLATQQALNKGGFLSDPLLVDIRPAMEVLGDGTKKQVLLLYYQVRNARSSYNGHTLVTQSNRKNCIGKA